MCLLLHPGFISTIHRTTELSSVQYTDWDHSRLELDVTLVHCYFTGQLSKVRMEIQPLLLTGEICAFAEQMCDAVRTGRALASVPCWPCQSTEATLCLHCKKYPSKQGDFLAGLGACIGAVQSVYLHGLLATVNEGSSPGR
ncbi:hypothetical protein FQN60_014791 [Etheostoma spectabile]|uniref:Uncharacterized protein n=1 Tax=Etheostoma spectabile TaxID=54343 RepID=A0A5J5CS18_9PERO|nr:hypothetical protein FQN60_014791 [Etheostoma spectabile]